MSPITSAAVPWNIGRSPAPALAPLARTSIGARMVSAIDFGSRPARWAAAWISLTLAAYSSGASIADGAGAAGRRVAVPADPHGNPASLRRLGQDVDVAHRAIFTLERDGVGRPHRAHELHVLVGHRAALLERWRAERLELLAQPADAGAEDHAPTGEDVDRREHLGGDQRVAVRHHHDADTEPRARR